MLGTWMIAAALAAPCSSVERADWIEGDHFWVEWDTRVCDAEIAQDILDWAEEARSVYTGELGYQFTDKQILIRVVESPGAGGLATTVACDDGTFAPLLTLYAANKGDPGENTSKHEVVHAVQYAYMGTYIDGITSWNWWMEGCAMWTTTFADGNILEWAGRADDYLEKPWIGLHQDVTAYSDTDRSRFLYSTGLIAQFLADYAGPEAVRATWEYGATQTGTPIWFPDAIDAAGVEWKPFWTEFMAAVTVLDIPQYTVFSDPVFVEERVKSLPASGAPLEEDGQWPQGMGLSVVNFRKSTGVPGMDLTVSFEGDPDVEWLAILVRTRTNRPGGKVTEIVEIPVTKGKGTAALADFDGTQEGFLVVSPQSMDLEGHAYGWSAELVDPTVVEEEPRACGCTHGGAATWLWLPLVALARRRE